jgi:hypothetical protein
MGPNIKKVENHCWPRGLVFIYESVVHSITNKSTLGQHANLIYINAFDQKEIDMHNFRRELHSSRGGDSTETALVVGDTDHRNQNCWLTIGLFSGGW